jgi:hypothetical protein
LVIPAALRRLLGFEIGGYMGKEERRLVLENQAVIQLWFGSFLEIA